MKTFSISVAMLAAGLAGGAVSAADPIPAAGATAATSAQADAADDKRYCIVDRLSDSRIPKKVCRTRAQWADEGVSVDGKQD